MNQSINFLILLILGGSPFIYIPFLVQKDKRKQNHLVWIVITCLLGLVQSMIYLMILISLDIPL